MRNVFHHVFYIVFRSGHVDLMSRGSTAGKGDRPLAYWLDYPREDMMLVSHINAHMELEQEKREDMNFLGTKQ